MKKWLSNKLKDFDNFGYPVSVHFNGKGNSFNTLLGGFCSFVMQVFMLSFLVSRSIWLTLRLNNSTGSSIVVADFEEIGEIKMNQ